ncbi:MAG: hypothetical protein AAB692_04195 [Patescibacteria group bacterium]
MLSAKYFRIAAALSLGGTIFAGYLSGYKLFTSTCAFNEPCPYVLGYPACWYGFAMFSAMLAISLAGVYRKALAARLVKALGTVSFAGIIFAGYLTLNELMPWFSGQTVGYSLGLPTCAYGLAFYIAIFVLHFFAV